MWQFCRAERARRHATVDGGDVNLGEAEAVAKIAHDEKIGKAPHSSEDLWQERLKKCFPGVRKTGGEEWRTGSTDPVV
jgi:hypothetical protein